MSELFDTAKPLKLKRRKVFPREKDVEKYFMWRIKKAGGGQWKWGSNGGTDRIVVIFGYHFFVELKAPDGRLRHNQKVVHKALRDHGAEVHVVVGHKGVDEFIGVLNRTIPGIKVK